MARQRETILGGLLGDDDGMRQSRQGAFVKWRDFPRGKTMSHGGKRKGAGRKPSPESATNQQVQIGRHPQEEIDAIDEAAKAAGKTRSAWAWEKLLRAAKRGQR